MLYEMRLESIKLSAKTFSEPDMPANKEVMSNPNLSSRQILILRVQF